MNRVIFDTLTFLNGFLAVFIVLLCTYIGWRLPALMGMQPIGLIAGAVCGVALAAIICGSLAFFALMERHMRSIAESAGSAGQGSGLGDRRSLGVGRREPSL